MKIIFSHPTGNANVRATAVALMKARLLYEFHTTIASFPGSFLDALAFIGPLSEIRRRAFDPILRSKIKMRPWLEIGRLTSARAGIKSLTRHEKGPFCIDAVYRDLDKHVSSRLKFVATPRVKGVYAYEDGAGISFQKAKELNLQCFYDLPIGYWRAARRLLKEEIERRPDWVSTLTGFEDSEAKLFRKDEELGLADRIFVASQFTAQTLKEFPGSLAPVEVIPYGFPEVNFKRNYSNGHRARPLKLLFVGSLSQRKGIADLFAVVENLGRHVELTVVGQKTSNQCSALDVALAQHRWIPSLPHAEIIRLMRESDVLIFPSLFEGFGLVITEAMSQGTPVITTERTIGPDIINHGENGWLIEAGSTDSLQSAIEKLLFNFKIISKVGSAAMETAKSRPWSIYGTELAAAIRKHIDAA